MKSVRRTLPLFFSALVFAWSTQAQATNGYFSHGYGTKAKGRGGVSIAIADDSMAAANNPAGFANLGNRFDAGFDAFTPKRGGQRTGGFDFNERSDRNLFVIPDLGFSYRATRDLTVGVTVYGNGGLNTDYQRGDTANCPTNPPSNTGNPFCGSGPAGVNLEQLVIAPTLAWKINDQHAVGISPLLTYQRFYAQGLQLFGQFGFSRDASKLTNNGTSTSQGIGYRLGYLGKFGGLRVGVSYSPKLDMSEFDEYAGLFAEQGDFDIPKNYGVGVAYQVTPQLLIGLDVTKVEYSGVASVGNPSGTANAFCANPTLSQGPCLGDSNGPGFGWGDVKTRKLGVEYAATDKLTVRAGFNKGDNPVKSDDVTFNILAPGVVQEHYTLGMSYQLTKWGEVSAHYMRAPSVSVSGNSAFAAFSPGTPRETIDMDQQSLSISFGVAY